MCELINVTTLTKPLEVLKRCEKIFEQNQIAPSPHAFYLQTVENGEKHPADRKIERSPLGRIEPTTYGHTLSAWKPSYPLEYLRSLPL